MRTSEYDQNEHSLRPKAGRIEEDAPTQAWRAGGTGRPDVLDAAAVLDLQRTVGNAGVGTVLEDDRSPVHAVIGSGGGSALAPDIRSEMESRLGHSFADVRVHTDTAAHESAKSVDAHAYTVGSDVVFQRDRYDPSSAEGKLMLAHELTHVVQQRSGPVDGSPAAGGIRVSDPSDRFEREATANAEAAMSGSQSAFATPSAVQRCEAHGATEEVAQSFVQRDEEPGDLDEEEPAPVLGVFAQREEEDEAE